MNVQKVVTGITVLVGLACATSTHAVVIGDFEGTDPGTWGYWSGGVQTPLNNDPNLELSTADKTTGLTSVAVTNVGYDQSLAFASNAATRLAFGANNILKFDVITTPSAAASGYWQVYELVINSPAGFTNVTSLLTNSDGNGNNIYWGPAAGDNGRRVVSFSVDYTSLKTAMGVNPNYAELVFSFNNDGSTNPEHANVYIDNVQLTSSVVPEPASLAVGGVAALSLLARRRRV